MNLSKLNIAFGNVEVNKTASDSFQITNTEAFILNVNISINNPKFSSSPLFYTIAPFGILTINVNYIPTSISDDSGIITVTTNDLSTPITYIGLTGSGKTAIINTSKVSISYGDVSYLRQKNESFNISNSSSIIPLKISNITLSNPNFSITETFPITLLRTSHTVSVQFTANSLSPQSCDLKIYSNDFTTPILIIPLTATVLQPEIVVSPISLDFETTTVGQPKSLNIIVSNFDLGDLHVNVTSSDPLFVASQTTLQVSSSMSASLSITFSPIDTGFVSATISLSTNDPDHLLVLIPISGTGKKSDIAVDKNNINFGKIGIYDSKQSTIKISSVGTVDLIVSNIIVSDPDFSISSSSFTVSPGQERSITITFNPTIIFSYVENLTIKNNSSSGDIIIDLTGISVSAGIYVNKTAINFGSVTINDTKTDNVLVSNMSVDDIDLFLRSVTTTNIVFKETIDTFKVHKGEALQIPITFSPVNVSHQTGKLIIESNDVLLPLTEVDLLGSGFIAPNIRLSTTLINFGDVAIGQTLSKTFQISNSGVSNLNVSNVVTNNSKFVVTPSSQIINPNMSKNFQVAFHPTDTTSILAKISITSNDPDSPVTYIELQGRGLSSSIEVSPTSIDFANVSVDDEKTMSFKISNQSPVELVVTNITVSNPLFSIIEILPLTIQTQQNINLVFSPEDIGLQQATLQIQSNDLNHPITQIDTRGAGVVPDISIQPTSLNYFNIAIGQSSDLSVSIHNIGLGKLIISNITSSDPAFAIDQTSFIVESGQTQNVIVSFVPSELGQKNATIHFINNDPDSPDIILPVEGYGAYPIATVSPNSINFGATVINSTKQQTITVVNSGRANLQVTISSNIPQYTISSSNLTVLPSTSQTIQVTFAPLLVSSYPGVITFLTNDPTHTSILVIATGAGIIAPKIAVNPRSLSFGEVVMGRSKQLTVTVANQGTQLLTFSTSIENPIRPGRPPTFSVSPTSGAVAISGQTILTVNFRPADPELLSGNLKINSNDISESLVEVSLKGSGKPAILEWDKLYTAAWIPRKIRTIANAINNVVPPLISALDLTKQVLDVIKLFIINIDDAMKILLTQVKKLIEDFINDLAASGLYVLYVLPGKAGINPETHPQYFRDLPASSFNIFDPNNPSWFDSVKGGYSSFVAKVADSFDDPADGNRPQFSSDAMVGGYVMMFDSGTINSDNTAAFIRAIQKLLRMFRSPFRTAFEPPSNIMCFASNNLVRVTFTPSISVLPKEYFIFRSEVQGGDSVVVSDSNPNVYKDESGKAIRTWKLVGITNVVEQLSYVMKVDKAEAKSMLEKAGYSAKQLASTVLGGDPFRFVFEDKTVTNDKTYYYVVAAGYTTSGTDDQSEYNDIITHLRKKPIYLKEGFEDSTGVYTSDFDKKINENGIEENIVPITETKILALGGLSAEVSAKPTNVVLETKGGLARCRNFRCGFEIEETMPTFDITTAEAPDFIILAKTPVAGSVKIKVKRGNSEFTANSSTYRTAYDSNKIYIKSIYYYKQNDALTISYKYRKDLQTKSIPDTETKTPETPTLGSDLTFLTTHKPIDYESVEVYIQGARVSDVTVLNDKDGRIKVNSLPGTLLEVRYKYYSDFSDNDFFKCVRSEYSRYFFDIAKCDGGSTLCPGYDNANCYYNTGSECKNTTEKSQRKVLGEGGFLPEDITFDAFWDPIACQNSMMKQRCDGYSKTFPRVTQKTWPDWSSVKLSALGMFPKIEEIMKVMENLIDSLLAGTEKMDTAITSFIDLLQKKIDALKQFIELINSYIQVILEDFSLPNLYFLNIPYARGGNEYLKTSIKNSINGPISVPSSYTAGVVFVYETPGLGDALNLFFG